MNERKNKLKLIFFKKMNLLFILIILNNHLIINTRAISIRSIRNLEAKPAEPADHSTSYSYVYDDESINDNTNSNSNTIFLNGEYTIKCPLNIKNDKFEFKFNELLFNRSISDLNNFLKQYKEKEDYLKKHFDLPLVIKSKILYDHLKKSIHGKKSIYSNEYVINPVRFSDTGHYYCVYNEASTNEIMIIDEYLKVIQYETIRTNLNEEIELKPCLDGNYDHENANHLNKTSVFEWRILDRSDRIFQGPTLKIKLNDVSLCDNEYECLNVQTGAFKIVTLECRNREEIFPQPLIFPSEQTVLVGQRSTFTCDVPKDSRTPDRIQWFQHNDELNLNSAANTLNEEDTLIDKEAFKLDIKNSIEDGNEIVLNPTNDGSDWFVCCFLYSKISTSERYEEKMELDDNNFKDSFDYACSSAKLIAINKDPPEIIFINNNNNTNNDTNNETKIDVNNNKNLEINSERYKLILVLFILIGTLVLLFGLSLLTYFGYGKYVTYIKALKAAQAMNLNEIYQSSNYPDDGNVSAIILEQFEKAITTNKCDLNKIFKSSSSIECLLNKEDRKKWRISMSDLTLGHVIGRGAFGVVIYAELKKKNTNLIKLSDIDSGLDSVSNSNTKPPQQEQLKEQSVNFIIENKNVKSQEKNLSVALKKLADNANSESIYDLFKELNLMFHVGEHPNIVNLIGYSIEDSSLYIITDYAKHGNLKDFLRKHHELTLIDAEKDTTDTISNSLIGFDRLLLYSYQISLGMQYLHSKKVLHRDLAARNILVDDYDSVKIADFGLARNLPSDYYYVQHKEGKMPLKWMSPEALSFNRISNESDIWSYGVLLWEIFTHGSTPYPSIPPENILSKLNEGYRMEKPSECDDFIYDKIILPCWYLDPKQRPTFTELIDLFEILFNSSNDLNIKSLIVKKPLKDHRHNNYYYNLNPNVKQTTRTNEDELVSQTTKVTNASLSNCSILSESMRSANIAINTTNFSTLSSSSFNPLSISSSSSNSSTSASSSSSSASSGQMYSSSSISFENESEPTDKLLEKTQKKTQNQQQELKKLQLEKKKLNQHTTYPSNSTRTNLNWKHAYRTDTAKNNPIYRLKEYDLNEKSANLIENVQLLTNENSNDYINKNFNLNKDDDVDNNNNNNNNDDQNLKTNQNTNDNNINRNKIYKQSSNPVLLNCV